MNSTALVTNSTEADKPFEDNITFGETLFYVSCGVIGTIFNSIVLWIALKYINTEDKPRQIIVINMAVADLLMCIVYMKTRPWLSYFNPTLCHPYYLIIWTCQMCSCLNLVWLNVDKLIYIQFPLHYWQIVNRVRLLWISAATWGVLIVLNIFLVSFLDFKGNCLMIDFNPYVYIFNPIFYVVMIITSFSLSALIYCIAHNLTHMEERQKSKLFRRLFFLFSSTLWTFFTCLPYRLLYLFRNFCGYYCYNDAYSFATTLFFRILIIGIMINPLITIWTQRVYRISLGLIFGRLRENSSTEVLMVTNRRASERPPEHTPLRCDI
uniref:G_PROTEIN_RECEP_F1_2 domain-containing protein n=1 Tax=Caenorhabditis japonica TaxID=281687 RepID=A0A8R1DQF4_CAEJA